LHDESICVDILDWETSSVPVRQRRPYPRDGGDGVIPPLDGTTGIENIFIDGSFCTEKPDPGDVDGYWVEPD
jgi:hypothetical protein